MKRIKIFVKNNYIVIISFLATLFLYLLCAFLNKLYPFGSQTYIYSDMFEQYVIYYNYIRDCILNGESLFASFSFSLGQNFYGIFTYFCSSPLNILFLFSTRANVPTFILIIASLKIALSSMNMAILLKTKLKNNLSIFIFSILYGLMTYNIAYSTNMMWLDPVYMLPIAILGLEKLAKGKPWLYVFALTFSICSNYYISFSVCIFLIIYFIYYSLLNKVDFKKFLFNFIKYSIISALLSSVILLPTIFNMINGKFETAGTDYSFSLLYNPIILIYKFLILDSKQVLSDLPFITSSLLILLLTPLYLFCKNITKKEKIVTYSVIVLLILITLFPFTDTIMHCFRLPNQFTCRYAFIVSFFLILTLSKCFDEAEFNKKNILLYLIAGFFIRFYLKLCIDFRTIISSILILAYFILVIFMKNKKLLAIAIIPFVILELLLNVSAHFRELGRRWYGEYQKLWAHEEKIEVLKPDQNNFYRISGLSHFTYNDALAYKYYGVTSFSPTVSVTTNKILKDYFASPLTESYAIDYVSTTAFSDSLLNVKYKYMINNDPGDEQEDFASYENKYVFPVMFKITQNDYFKEGKTKIETQNNLYKYLTNTDDILFEETENYIIKGCHYENDTMYVDEEGFCSFKLTDENNQYYVELSGASNLMTPVYDGIVTTEHYSGTFILDVNGDARVFFSEKEVKLDYLKAYKMNYEKLANLTSTLTENGLNITSHSQNKITGTIVNNEENQIMFTSIPYDKGWHVSINGKEVETFKNLDSLLAFNLPEGELEIEVTFVSQGFNVGLFISLFTLDLLFVLRIRKGKED